MNKSGIKIGVLTFHNGPNFGGVLQAWHLIQAIRKLGYSCHAVNYLHESHDRITQTRIPLRNLSSLKARIYWMLKKRGFKGFTDTLCRHSYTTCPEQVPWHGFDAFVVGSDVVWEYENQGYGQDPAYFGQMPFLRDKPILSYAASCGPASSDGPFPEHVKHGLARFIALGVRDEATARLVTNASGRDSTLVVDPTWLGPDREVDWPGRPKNKYLFVYGGRRIDDHMGQLIRNYCRRKGLEFVSALTPCKSADRMYRTLTPFQWVSLFRHAEATIVMGTLHGTVYSIKYGKPFILVTNPSTTQKITSILQRIGQGHRLLQAENFDEKSFELLDEGLFERPQIPDVWRTTSIRFLEQSLASAAANC